MVTRTDAKLTGSRNQCPGCGELFNSTPAFDKHRAGRFGKPADHGGRRCRTEAEMLAAGMVRNSAGFWIGKPMPENAQRRPPCSPPLTYPQGG